MGSAKPLMNVNTLFPVAILAFQLEFYYGCYHVCGCLAILNTSVLRTPCMPNLIQAGLELISLGIGEETIERLIQ